MSYSQFSLSTIISSFNLTIVEKTALFKDVVHLSCPPLLAEILNYNVPLALASNTEKSRSEMIIAPILIELKKQLPISLFSGIEFNVDSEKGLMGFCDFIISYSPEQLFVKTPVIMLVEAKNENIKNGLGQCIAEMLAAQIFNQKNEVKEIYGVVTTGTNWKFLKLKENTVEIDMNEYYLSEIDKILGILHVALNQTSRKIC
ncbi:MAG: hypothetical protein KAG43_00325 [Candidatus Marithrix sp.]|nr:hypothetical protein [Candidatus Marithrix sp.]